MTSSGAPQTFCDPIFLVWFRSVVDPTQAWTARSCARTRMHEVSLCRGVLDVVEDERRRQDFAKVRKIVLEIGVLGHVEPEAMLFCFDAVSRGTVAEGATIKLFLAAMRHSSDAIRF